MDLSHPWMLLAAVPAAAVLTFAWVTALRRGRRGKLALLLRSVAAALLVLCAAGLLVRSGGRPRALVLLDRSASLGSSLDRAGSAAAVAGRQLAERFEVSYASFALTARPETAEGLAGVAADASGTDLGAALACARAQLGAGEPAVLVTDGLSTAGRARTAAAAWGRRSPALVILPAGPESPDAALIDLDAPAEVRPRERFGITVQIAGRSPAPVEVRLVRTTRGGGRRELPARTVGLPAGRRGVRLIRFEDLAPPAGRLEYSAELVAASDAESGNNSARAFTRVLGRLRAGIISRAPSPAAALLSSAGIDARRLDPAALPGDLSTFEVLFLEDLPREALGSDGPARLAAYVKSGGGAVVLGGPRSYASGGYYDSGGLERVLPASMVPPDDKGLFSVLVLDRSGSMGNEVPGKAGKKKLDMVKSAAERVIAPDSFGPRDRLAVIAFAESPRLVAGPAAPRDARQAARLREALGRLTAAGSTNLVAALEQADALLRREAGKDSARHVLLLSDGLPVNEAGRGGAQKPRLRELAAGLARGGATLSTVGTGAKDEDTQFLAELARLGRGRFYRPADLAELATIFLRDMWTRKARVAEGRFRPVPASRTLPGLPAQLPELEARNRISAKKDAWTALEAPAPGGRGREPLLVAWDRGRGRAACFASGVAGAWNRDALSGEAGKKLLGALARWAAGRAGRSGCRLELSPGRRGGFRLALVARDERGAPLSALSPVARVVGLNAPVHLLQESPSRYAARIAVPAEAAEVAAAVEDPRGGELARGVFPLAYPREISRVGADLPGLRELARLTGGRVISSPAELARAEFPRAAGRGRAPAAPWLAAAALLLVMVELVLRARGR
jgi:Mg-chelatase subunit ChlD